MDKNNATALHCSPVPQPGPRRQWCDGWWWLLWSAPAAHSAAAGAETPQRTPGTLQEPLHAGAGRAGNDPQKPSFTITERALTNMAFNKEKALVEGPSP